MQTRENAALLTADESGTGVDSLETPTVWIVALDGFAPHELAHLCTPDDVARQQRLRFPHLRRRAEVRCAALRHIIGKHLALPPRTLVFERDRWGKPRLAAGSDRAVHFNSTHSTERAAIVLATMPVGIDLEHAAQPRSWDDFREIVCTRGERDFIEALAPEHRLRAFYRLWVAKEALVKADGRGLSVPVNDIDATAMAAEAAQARVWMPSEHAHRHVRRFEIGQDYVGALAASCPIGEAKLVDWAP